MRCRECGAELAADVRACPACDADAGEALPVVDPDDAELAIRTEDRYASVPPGLRWIRSRVHDMSKQLSITILIGLGLLFALGVLLQRSTSERAEPPPQVTAQSLPSLHRSTSASLLMLAPDGLHTLDVDGRRFRTSAIAELPPGPVTAAATDGNDAVVVVGHRAYVVPPALDRAVGIGPAVEVYPSHREGRVWLLTYPADGSVVAREVDLDGVETTPPAVLGGSTTVRGAVGDVVVVDRLGADGTRLLATWDPTRPADAPAPFRTDALFVAASRDVVASRPSRCSAARCDLYLDAPATGERRVIENALGGGGVTAAAFTDSGRRLAVVETDGDRSRGTIVDTTTGAVSRFTADPTTQARPALAWNRNSSWLFLATSSGTVDAVDRNGHSYAVPVARIEEGTGLLPRSAALPHRHTASTPPNGGSRHRT
ncbi:MAG TPA: hypothetical protein VKI01_03170 [Acidimicrobiia bacterium]|nr:hypothetical protein [Acidimicrobiia bacterium]